MNILQVIQARQMRGAEVFACQLATELQSHGHRVWVVALFAGDQPLPFSGEILVLNANKNWRFVDLFAWKKLNDLVVYHKIDVVQANAADTLKYAVLSRFFFRWRAKIVLRNASTVSRWITGGASLAFNRWLVHRANYVVSVSERSMKDFVVAYRYGKPITTIPIGVYLPEVRQEEARRFDVIHIGAFTPEKNHQGLLHILNDVARRMPDLRVALIGNGVLFEDIRRSIDTMALTDHIEMLGAQPEPETFLRQARCLVLTSTIEGLPAVILEALANKVPVVSYNVGGVSEVLVHGETGMLINLHDESSFADAVVALLEDPTYASRLGQNGYVLVSSRFLMRQVARQFEDVYNSIV